MSGSPAYSPRQGYISSPRCGMLSSDTEQNLPAYFFMRTRPPRTTRKGMHDALATAR